MAASPSAFLRMLKMIREIDVRPVLAAIHVPTLVIKRIGDRITPPSHGRHLAARIAGARYFEQPGDHSLRFAESGDADELFAAIRAALAGRAAIHTGEVDVAGGEIGGLTLAVARGILACAGPREVVVSRTVTDLVVGSGFAFADHGSHELAGVPGSWELSRL
jgi:class 3 adenylate cyclase